MAKQASAKAQASTAPKAFKPALLLVLLLPAAFLMAPIAIVMVAALVPSVVARSASIWWARSTSCTRC